MQGWHYGKELLLFTNNWSADNLKKHFTSLSCTLEPEMQSCGTGLDTLLDCCQLSKTWKSTIDLNTDCICVGLLTNNARSLQENLACLAANQSARTIIAI